MEGRTEEKEGRRRRKGKVGEIKVGRRRKKEGEGGKMRRPEEGERRE